MNFAFLGPSIAFLAIGYHYYSKAKKMPQTNEAELKEYKKAKSIAITFMFAGLPFFVLALTSK